VDGSRIHVYFEYVKTYYPIYTFYHVFFGKKIVLMEEKETNVLGIYQIYITVEWISIRYSIYIHNTIVFCLIEQRHLFDKKNLNGQVHIHTHPVYCEITQWHKIYI
jgi:hypothetical protein